MRKLYLFLPALLLSILAFGQTVLISPTGDGGFENGTTFAANGWTVENGTANHKWFLGTVPGFSSRAAYISNSPTGATWTFTNTINSVSHFYRDVTIPAGETNVTLSFNWIGLGEAGSWDAIMVSVAPTTYIPVADATNLATGGLAAPASTIAQFWNQTTMQSASVKIPASILGNCTAPTTVRLIFTWKNDDLDGVDPPGAVDNISLTSQSGIATLPQSIDFTGFTGANLNTVFPNWYEAVGFSAPTGTTSSWINSTGLGSAGNTTAKINFFVASKRDWIVGPRFTAAANTHLRFEAAITDFASLNPDPSGMQGTDDSLIVRISTDCGLTWTNLQVFEASNTTSLTNVLTESDISLAAYAGQNVMIGFYGSEGLLNDLPDYDFHLDNIQILNVFPTDVGATALVLPNTTQCPNANTVVAVTIKNFGSAPLNFASTPVTVTTNITGPVTQTMTGVKNTGTLLPGETVDVFMTGSLNNLAAGTYTYQSYTTMTGDAQPSNDTIYNTRTTIAPATVPQIVDFTGFTGSNLSTVFPGWYEATGLTTPTGTTANWTSSSNLGSAGNVTAKINFFVASKRDWIVGPKFTVTSQTHLKFDVAITDFANLNPDPAGMQGTDDSLIVRISTDCGITWMDLLSFEASNTSALTNVLTETDINLSAYAGQNVIIGFYGSEGLLNDLPDYDFHIDNIQIINVFPTDVGATALALPTTGGCPSATTQVSITIKNLGSTPLNFATNPVTVTTEVTGAATQTLVGIKNTGTLLPNETVDVLMSTTLNNLAGGVYSFRAYTTMVGDPQAANDTMATVTRTTIAPVTVPQTVDFTGYTGANLSTVFPGWSEAAGYVPTGTTSSWLNRTGLGGATNVTAKVNLVGATKKEWIISPKFIVTAQTHLKFDAAITDLNSNNPDAAGMQGTDDSVIVRISIDCGVSWTDLYVFDASSTTSLTNTLTESDFNLTSYAGQNAIIAFYASEGLVDNTPSYDFHIDNIQIVNVYPTDLKPAALSYTLNGNCPSNAAVVTVTVKNVGSAPINFATNPVTITSNVTGAVTQVMTGLKNTGTLLPNETVDVVLTGTLNMAAGGTFNFQTYTTMVGDQQVSNDTITTTAVIASAVPLPITNDFTGYTGANLSTVFPGWSEASGFYPTGTTSSWLSQANFGTGNTTAKVNLFTTTNRHWIIGPKFTATTLTMLMYKLALTNWDNLTVDADGMGADDTLAVRISIDCGLTWTDLKTYDQATVAAMGLTNVLQSDTIDLMAYAGQSVMIAFYASDGLIDDIGDYNLHVDDINIADVPACTGAVGGVATPPATLIFCGSANVTITATGYSTGRQSGYQWEASSSPTFASGVTPVVGQTNPATMTSGIITDTTYFRLKVTCPSGTATDYSNIIGIIVNPAPTITLTPAAPDYCPGGSVVITASGNSDSYTWSPATGLSATTGSTVTANPTVTTTYTVTGTITATGCTNTNTVKVTVNPAVTVTASAAQTTVCNGSSTQLTAVGSQNITAIKITEVTQFRGGTGATNPYPSYVVAAAQDLIEISNISTNPFDISGFTFYDYTNNSATSNHTPYTFPAGTVIPGNGVLILHMGPGTNDPANLYFNMGGASDFWQSGTAGGFVLKNGGSIIDAVATGGTGTTYTFNAGTGVTAADWSGTTLTTSGFAGITRTAATDNNTIADWTRSSATSLQTVGTYNGGFTVPSSSFSYVWSPTTGLSSSTIANPVATVTGDITYTVTATETTTGCSGTANVALTVALLPAITTQPSNQTICVGNTASFSVVATGTAITYQWRKNGVNIAGATSASYSIPNATTADAGTFDVVVSGQCPPTVTSTAVTLTVNTPPAITAGAVDQSLCVGSRLVIRPTFTGSSLTYQWYKGASALAGETNDSLVIASVAAGDAGNYIIVVTGVCPPATVSDTMTLTVNGAPIITGQPTGSTVCLGAPATFTVSATGSGLTYQWRKGGVNIAGATSATYTIAATVAGDGGSYDVVITSSCATTATSTAVTLVVNMPPAITTQPTAQTTCIANSATFSVTATGAGLTYQWRKNGVNIAGANASTYTIANVSAGDLGNYDVVVTGTCGSPAISNSVALNLSATNTWLGRMNSDWNNAGNWCSGIPTSTTDVLIPAGTPFPAIINTSGDVRNLTIQTGATLTVPAGGTLNLYGDLVNTGTLTSTSGTIAFRGATNQAVSAVSAAYIVMNGAGGITLSGNMTVGTGLTLTNGNITLGSNNLVMTGGSMGSVASHIITNGTGVVTINNVTTAAVIFPIGPNATSYNPAAVANGSGRNFSARVVVGLTQTIPNLTRAINRTWTITPSASSATPAYVGLQYADADGNAAYVPTANMEIGVHNGTTWSQISVPGGMLAIGTAAARQVGASTTVFGSFATANLTGIFSPVAVSNLDADVTSSMLMPNVVKDKTQMQVVVRKAVKVEWNITDASGRVVRTFSKRLVAGVNTIELRVGDLAGGTYYITGVTEKGKVQVLRMIRL
jgi:hypothetical protein